MRQSKRSFNWFAVLLLFIVLYFSYTAIQQYLQLKAISQEQAAVEARLSQAQKVNEELLQEKNNLGKIDYIEKIAREELGMTKQGEMPYISSKK
ncbi:MAG: FtsB family cell division protein [Selenomonadaceae bacterium]